MLAKSVFAAGAQIAVCHLGDAGHLLFSIGTMLHILIAVRIEEHDLTVSLGDRDRQYWRSAPMFIPHPVHRG